MDPRPHQGAAPVVAASSGVGRRVTFGMGGVRWVASLGAVHPMASSVVAHSVVVLAVICWVASLGVTRRVTLVVAAECWVASSAVARPVGSLVLTRPVVVAAVVLARWAASLDVAHLVGFVVALRPVALAAVAHRAASLVH